VINCSAPHQLSTLYNASELYTSIHLPHTQTGEICLDILKTAWTPAWTLESVCQAVLALLSAPAADSPLNCDAGGCWCRRRGWDQFSMKPRLLHGHAVFLRRQFVASRRHTWLQLTGAHVHAGACHGNQQMTSVVSDPTLHCSAQALIHCLTGLHERCCRVTRTCCGL
jgi:hypothetical protein